MLLNLPNRMYYRLKRQEDEEVHSGRREKSSETEVAKLFTMLKSASSLWGKAETGYSSKRKMLFSLPAKQNRKYLGIVEITTPNFLPLCQKQTNKNNYLLPQSRKIYSLTA